MSLILDTLNKMKEGGNKKPVPPSISKKKKKNNNNKKRYIILASLIIFLSTVMTFLVVFQDRFIYENKSEFFQIVENKANKNVQVSKPIVENPEILEREQKNEPNYEKTIKNPDESSEKTETLKIKSKPQENPEKLKTKKIAKNERPNKKADKNFLFSTYISQANQYIDQKNYEKALIYLEKAYRLSPSEKILKNIILLKLETGRASDIQNYLNRIKNKEFLSEILIGLIDTGNTQIVHDYLTKNLKNDTSGYLYYVAGYLYEKEGKYKEALKYYKTAYKLNRKDPYIAYAYARILELNGEYTKALNVYKSINLSKITDNNLREVVAERIRLLGEP
ncbi:tetratricopeptide repeat protein [Persephonella sp. KM09-Lau-8]|uniref:tetratricopeptide repeat protein n=1 Tax=Persephonella sp. KM09-Lau-8 TaxID=1158345 RepID=UPI0004956119|nr:tetratricopeptide repeat protein [Persephonella sp. KM09-Lau-8]